MLDQLVESRNKVNDGKMRGGLFVMSSFLVIMILFGATIWSIFAKDINISGDGLQLSALVTPIPLAASEPEPEPAPKQERKTEQPKNEKQMIAKRQTNTLRLDESPTKLPTKVSVTKNTSKARPNALFEFTKGAETEAQGAPQLARGMGNPNSGGVGIPTSNNTKHVEPEVIEKPTPKPPPPLPPATPKPTPKPPPAPISGGVVNGKAIDLPKPNYPAAAKAIRADGEVSVQVTIDEYGNVIAANTVSGHALLRSSAVSAALNAKFRPTLLSDQPVKVKGVIIYKFAM
ncbi:hypothetical protein BH24ACI2_BH24ACI2_15340 [soil metagenome]